MSLEFAELHRRHTPEPELVPILDALTCIIFFLMYTTTFMELTSLTLPPSAVSVVSKSDSSAGVPLIPKLFIDIKDQTLVLKLKWMGQAPGNVVRKLERTKPERYSAELEKTVNEIVTEFAKRFPSEKSLQIAIADRGTYQELISIMDGITKSIPDVVLLSPDDVKNMNEEDNGS
ncbi:MAG: biopolymer transporter ExbD [Bdellovibrionaceae bacterium]|nr:biopolymer transporter ExbD [Pseudobdellovibrionaceae bacterium]